MTHQWRKRLLIGAAVLLFLAFWLYLAWCVPFCHDDWDWGLEIGLENWLTASINNRYVGNFFIILMTRWAVAKVLVLGGGMFAIPLLMALLVAPDGKGERRAFLPLYLGANLLCMLLPPRVWRQSYGWLSGFANYGVSAVFFLLWLLLLRWFLAGDQERWRKGLAILPVYTALLGLFLENLALIHLLFALCVFLYTLFTQRGRGMALGVVVGALIGCILIFRNPIYNELLTTGHALGNIRNLAFPADGTLAEMADAVSRQLFGKLIPRFFQLGPVFPAILALVAFAALWQGPVRPLCILSVWPLTYGMLEIWFTNDLSYLFSFWGGIASLIIPCFAVTVSGGPLPRRLIRLVLLLSGFGSIVPVALTKDVGGRFYFLFYLLAALVLLDLAAPLLAKQAALSVSMCACMSLSVMFLWGYAYTQIAQCSALRQQLIDTAIEWGAQHVVLPTDRYGEIEWCRNPDSPQQLIYYREFYGIPQDVKVIFLAPGSYEHWPYVQPEDWAGATDYNYWGKIMDTIGKKR